MTGVCFIEPGNHWKDRLWFEVRMRSPGDVMLLKLPRWWNVERLFYVVMFLSMATVLAVIWVGLLDRRLRLQSAALAKQSMKEASRQHQAGPI